MDDELSVGYQMGLLDADGAAEALRKWRLGCIRAEAELRALNLQRDATDGTASDECVDESKALAALSGVLALQKHLAEREDWLSMASQKIVDVKCRIARTDQVFKDEVAIYARLVADNASSALDSSNASERDAHRGKRSSGHAQTRSDSAHIHAELEDMLSTLPAEESEVAIVAEQAYHEEVIASEKDAEMHSKFSALTEAKKQSSREIAQARRLDQARQMELTRLQSDFSRCKSRRDRLRRTTECQLTRWRADFEASVARADEASEKIRKVRNQHGRQLRTLRAATGGLQEEVNVHLQCMEASEEEYCRLRGEEQNLYWSYLRHAQQEEVYEEQIESLQIEATCLLQKMDVKRNDLRHDCDHLENVQVQCVAEERINAEECEEIAAIRLEAQQEDAVSNVLSTEIREEQAESALHASEMRRLRTLGEEARMAKANRNAAADQTKRSHDGAKHVEQQYEAYASEMAEALRRTSRLKNAHAELAEAIRSGHSGGGNKSRDVLLGTLDQCANRAAKKAEALSNFFEGPRKPIGPSGSGRAGGARGRQLNGAMLRRRLRAEMENEMELALGEQRRRVIAEQERAIEDARRRSAELQVTRRKRRLVEAELVEARRLCAQDRMRPEEGEINLQAQLVLLDQEAAEDASAVSKELTEMLREQSQEREALLKKIEECKREIARRSAGNLVLRATPPEELTAEERTKMEETERELIRLRLECEQVREACVVLHASLIANGTLSNNASGFADRPKSPPLLAADVGRGSGWSSPEPASPSHGEVAGGQVSRTAPRQRPAGCLVPPFPLGRSGSVASSSSLSTSGSLATGQGP